MKRRDFWEEPPLCPQMREGGIVWRALQTLRADRTAVIVEWRDEDRPERLVLQCEADRAAARLRLAEAEVSGDADQVDRCWRSAVSFDDKMRRLAARMARPLKPPEVLEGRAGQRVLARPVAAALEQRLRVKSR